MAVVPLTLPDPNRRTAKSFQGVNDTRRPFISASLRLRFVPNQHSNAREGTIHSLSVGPRLRPESDGSSTPTLWSQRMKAAKNQLPMKG